MVLGDMQTLCNWFPQIFTDLFFFCFNEISEVQKSTQDDKKVCISAIETH